jgi:hypothetical protein
MRMVLVLAAAAACSCGLFETRSAATPTPGAIATTPAVAATPTRGVSVPPAGAGGQGPCDNTFPTKPIVQETRLRDLQWSLDLVTDFYSPAPGYSRWNVRFFVPSGGSGEVTIPINAILEGPGGALAISRYEVGPPQSEPVAATKPIVLRPCRLDALPGSPDRGAMILLVYAPPIDSGAYSLRVPGIRLPSGSAQARFDVILTCTRDTQAASAGCV